MSEVKIGCPCPKRDGAARHPDGDTLTFRERLDFRSAFAVRNEFGMLRASGEATIGEAMAALTEGFLIYGIEAWTLTDEKDRPIPVNRPAIRRYILSDLSIAEPAADAADELYGPVILPLVVKVSSSSPTSSIESETSAKPDSKETTPSPSSPSSTTTSPTDATETTSPVPAGVSS